MNKAFDKILEMLDNYIEDAKSEGDFSYIKPFEIAKRAVQEVAEEYTSTEHINCSTNTSTDTSTNGWIPCSERLPKEYGDYLVWWTDITRGQYYEIVEYEPSNGWIGDIPQAVEGKYSVIAWQPLPQPPKGE